MTIGTVAVARFAASAAGAPAVNRTSKTLLTLEARRGEKSDARRLVRRLGDGGRRGSEDERDRGRQQTCASAPDVTPP
jgi:hypothetical protein